MCALFTGVPGLNLLHFWHLHLQMCVFRTASAPRGKLKAPYAPLNTGCEQTERGKNRQGYFTTERAFMYFKPIPGLKQSFSLTIKPSQMFPMNLPPDSTDRCIHNNRTVAQKKKKTKNLKIVTFLHEGFLSQKKNQWQRSIVYVRLPSEAGM